MVSTTFPTHGEDLARIFYGEILGLSEQPKPEHLYYYTYFPTALLGRFIADLTR